MPVEGDSGAAGSSRALSAPATAVPSSLTIKAFDAEKTTCRRWLQRLQGAFMIFKIRGNDRVPYLLHYVGAAAFDILCDRLDSEDPFCQTFERLTSTLEDFYDPPPLEIAENFRFHQQRQESGENVQQFATALHKLSIHCNFGEYLKTALRNQLVFGLASKKIQTRLLEKKDLTYEEALRVATTMELSEKGSTSLQVLLAQPTAQIDVVQAGKKKQRKQEASKSRILQKGKFTHEFPNNNNNNNVNFRNNNTASNYCASANYSGNSNFPKRIAAKTVTCYSCGRGHLASQCTINRDVRCSGCDEKGT